MARSPDISPSSYSSSEDGVDRKRKLKKKNKRKSEKKSKKSKKEKRHKLKKRSRNSTSTDVTAVKHPAAHSEEVGAAAATASDDVYGPALPPQLQDKPATVIGPAMPENFESLTTEVVEGPLVVQSPQSASSVHEDEDLVNTFGPLPVSTSAEGGALPMTAPQIELEQRALQLKLAAIDGTFPTNAVEQNIREEWMLELPDVGLKSGLAALANMKRTFHQGKERPDFSDRSAWTKTPQSAEKPQKATTSKATVESLKNDAQELYNRQRDEDQERIAKKHKKKHKREESLVDIHQKKLRKEQRQKEKELAASGAKPERRPFSRDVDLKLNKIDKNQTKQIVDKAKVLDTKFSTGHTKYL